jgi:hypothetical protein
MTNNDAMSKLLRIYRYLCARGDMASANLVYRVWYWGNEGYH